VTVSVLIVRIYGKNRILPLNGVGEREGRSNGFSGGSAGSVEGFSEEKL
jgi:hypothetical protein